MSSPVGNEDTTLCLSRLSTPNPSIIQNKLKIPGIGLGTISFFSALLLCGIHLL